MIKWEKRKVNKLIEYKSGYTWSKDQEEHTLSSEDSIRVLTITNIQKELNDKYKLYLKKVKKKDKSEKKVTKNWIITVTSNGNRDRIGNSIFIGRDMEVLFASFLGAFKPLNENKLIPKYFYYWINQYDVQKRIASVAEGTTGLGNMNLRHFKSMEIYYPDKATQEKIALILSTIDKNIKQTKEVIKKAERLKKSIMQNLLTGKIKPDGTKRREDEFYTDEKFGKVPKSWKISKIKELAECVMGQSPDSATFNEERKGLPFVQGMADIGEKYPKIRKYTLDPKKESFNGDILITVRAPVGKVFINNKHIAIGRGIGALKEINRTNYLFYYLMNWEIHFKIFEQGTTFKEINQTELKRITLIIPKDIKEIKQIVSKIEIMDAKLDFCMAKLSKFEKLKKSLMQNLLTGKIEVK